MRGLLRCTGIPSQGDASDLGRPLGYPVAAARATDLRRNACQGHGCMRRRCLWRRGRHWSPSPWALWDIGVVARRIVTVIPRALWRRCYRQLGGWRYDDWRVGIRVGIGIAIRSPVGSPERPHPDPDGNPWTAKPMKASVETSVEASVEASKPPSSPRIARPSAGHKQRRQHHDDAHPRRPLARCLVPGIHGDHLPVSRCVSPVRCHIPRPG